MSKSRRKIRSAAPLMAKQTRGRARTFRSKAHEDDDPKVAVRRELDALPTQHVLHELPFGQCEACGSATISDREDKDPPRLCEDCECNAECRHYRATWSEPEDIPREGMAERQREKLEEDE